MGSEVSAEAKELEHGDSIVDAPSPACLRPELFQNPSIKEYGRKPQLDPLYDFRHLPK